MARMNSPPGRPEQNAPGVISQTIPWVSFTASSSSTVISFESLEDDGTCAGLLVDHVWGDGPAAGRP